MKPCPFCAEQIQDAAIKCRFCGSMLDEEAPATGAASQPSAIEIYRGRPSWKAQFGAHLAAVLLVIAGPGLGLAMHHRWAQDATPSGIVAGVLGVTGLVWLLVLWLQRFVQFRITTRSIDRESGIIGKRIETIQLWKVKDIEYHQTVFDRVLGLARIRVHTQDVTAPQFIIWGMPGSRDVFDRLKDAVERSRKSQNLLGIVE